MEDPVFYLRSYLVEATDETTVGCTVAVGGACACGGEADRIKGPAG